MFEFTNEQKELIMQGLKASYGLYEDITFVPNNSDCRIYGYPQRIKYKCHCKLGKGKIIEPVIKSSGEWENHCVYCQNAIWTDMLHTKDNAKKIKAYEKEGYGMHWNMSSKETSKKIGSCYFVCKNPNEQYGILIIKASVTVKVSDNKEKVFDEDVKADWIIHVNSGKPSYAKKISRGKENDMDLFDAFNINSKIAKDGVNIIWDNANGMLDFVLKNKEACSRFGILECFNQNEQHITRSGFFMMYMYLYCMYPAVELLVKMNNICLVSEIIHHLTDGWNKENIRNRSKDLEKLINEEATKGKEALRIPTYISDFLAYKEANIKEFLAWCDLYELEGYSKEYFMEIVEDPFYYEITRYNDFKDLLCTLRYGYTYKKLSKYVQKQAETRQMTYRQVLSMIDDYRNMMNIMEIEAEMFPGNLQSVHDNAMKAYRANQDAINNKALTDIAKKAMKAEIENEEYCIVVPETVTDFISEGNQQHNCVSSYVRRVINKDCVIFFIRKKEDPTESFITAECRTNGLNQIMYKNNVPVSNKDLVAYATEFCDKIRGMHLV